jgi:hypothetical protein
MSETTRLNHMIRTHWLKHRPQMVEELTRRNQLSEALRSAEERTADLLYELISVQKMDYQAAWELATEEWRLPESEALRQESSSMNQILSPPFFPPATSE